VKLTNPAPNPDPAGWRKDYLGFDARLASFGEDFGKAMQGMVSLPASVEQERRLFQEASKPGATYAFRFAGQGQSSRSLVLSFLRRNANETEVEIYAPRDHKPFMANTPVWTGLSDPRNPKSIQFGNNDQGWAFTVGEDGLPEIRCPRGGQPGTIFPTQEIPLFALKQP
jgi:hypothetical protein